MKRRSKDISLPIIDDVSQFRHQNSWQEVAQTLAELTDADVCCIKSLEKDGLEILALDGKGAQDYHRGQIITTYQKSFCHSVIAHGDPLLIPDARGDSQWRAVFEYQISGLISYYGLPILTAEKEVFGTLAILHKKPHTYSVLELKLTGQLRQRLEADLAQDYWFHKYRTLVETDETTGISNHRGFLLQAGRLYEIAKREKREFAVLCCQIEPATGAAHGETIDETLIASVAALLKKNTRKTELMGYLGSGLFLIATLPKDQQFCEIVVPRIHDQLTRHFSQRDAPRLPGLRMAYETFSPPHQFQSMEGLVKRLTEKIRTA